MSYGSKYSSLCLILTKYGKIIKLKYKTIIIILRVFKQINNSSFYSNIFEKLLMEQNLVIKQWISFVKSTEKL